MIGQLNLLPLPEIHLSGVLQNKLVILPDRKRRTDCGVSVLELVATHDTIRRGRGRGGGGGRKTLREASPVSTDPHTYENIIFFYLRNAVGKN